VFWYLGNLCNAIPQIHDTQPREGTGFSKNRSFEELMESGLRSEKVGDSMKALSYFSEARK